MAEQPLEREDVLVALGVLGDIRAGVDRVVELMEDGDGEEAEED